MMEASDEEKEKRDSDRKFPEDLQLLYFFLQRKRDY